MFYNNISNNDIFDIFKSQIRREFPVLIIRLETHSRRL